MSDIQRLTMSVNCHLADIVVDLSRGVLVQLNWLSKRVITLSAQGDR